MSVSLSGVCSVLFPCFFSVVSTSAIDCLESVGSEMTYYYVEFEVKPYSLILSKTRLSVLHFVAESMGLVSVDLTQLAPTADILYEIVRIDS